MAVGKTRYAKGAKVPSFMAREQAKQSARQIDKLMQASKAAEEKKQAQVGKAAFAVRRKNAALISASKAKAGEQAMLDGRVAAGVFCCTALLPVAFARITVCESYNVGCAGQHGLQVKHGLQDYELKNNNSRL